MRETTFDQARLRSFIADWQHMTNCMEHAFNTNLPTSPSVAPVLRIEGLRQEFRNRRSGSRFVVEVDGPLEFPAGGFIAVQGPNGCGKTTLMTVLALLRSPSNLSELKAFHLQVLDRECNQLRTFDLRQLWRTWAGWDQISTIRRRFLGFSPQQLELLPALNVKETLGLALWFNGVGRKARHQRVQELLVEFELSSDRVERNLVRNISGGQQQKVSLARAIAHEPPLVFLDEPTAFLHPRTAYRALHAMRKLQLASAGRSTIVMITHDHDLARNFATRIVEMNGDGTKGWVEQIRENTPENKLEPGGQASASALSIE